MLWTFEWAVHLRELYSTEASFHRASRAEPKPSEGGALSPSSTCELSIENAFNGETFVFAAEEADPTAASFKSSLRPAAQAEEMRWRMFTRARAKRLQ